MSRVFCDLGYNRGQGLADFVHRLQIDETWKVHCFEPTPSLWPGMVEYFVSGTGAMIPINNHRVAAWTEDCELEFKIDTIEQGVGSTLLLNSQMGGLTGESVEVAAICFTEWLEANTAVTDEVFIKMDIEGAEFPVLRKMLENPDIFGRIDKMWIEFHQRFIPEESDLTVANLLDELMRFTQVELHG